MKQKNCLFCNKIFFVPDYRDNSAKFCSQKCAGKQSYKKVKKYFLDTSNRKRDKHWNWKGGKKINSQGYILIFQPNHPFSDNQGYVREHRLVMEKHIGRYLKVNEQIHHINMIKTDNNISNLKLYNSASDHIKNEHKREPGLKINKTCPYCNKHFQVFSSQKRIVCCSQSCSTKMRWKDGVCSFGR